MIYIVCPNVALGKSYVEREIKGNPNDREFQYITLSQQCPAIQLVVGDKVHKISTNEYPMAYSLYYAWENVERRSGIPVLAKPPFIDG